MIGVFDSGSGGLTVLRALVTRLPEQRFVYLGDHAHAPYGDRSPEEIYELTRLNVERLFALGCSLVVLACNTAAAVALRRLQQTWLQQHYPEHRVLGVLVPVVEDVTRVPWQTKEPTAESKRAASRVAIFATARTVESGAYPREIGCRAPAISVLQQACPDLVGRIESGAGSAEARAAVSRHVESLLAQADGRPLDKVILGCTHYPLIEEAFRATLPRGTPILSQPELVAESLRDYLRRHPQHDDAHEGERGRLTAFSTGGIASLRPLGQRFFGAPLAFCRIGAEPPSQVSGESPQDNCLTTLPSA